MEEYKYKVDIEKSLTELVFETKEIENKSKLLLEENKKNIELGKAATKEDVNNINKYLDKILKHMDFTKSINIYVAPKENVLVENDGLSTLSPITLAKAFELIKNNNDVFGWVNGKWVINLAPGSYTGTDTNVSLSGIRSKNRLLLKGPVVEDGQRPLAIFDGEMLNAVYKHGMEFNDCYLQIEDILFTKFMETSTIQGTQTRCGVSFTDCNTVAINVWADGCSWAGINCSGGRIYNSSGKINNCRIGIAVQFNAQCSLGWIDGSYSDDKRCNITNCIDAGVKLADGTVGHIDYLVLDNNINGIVMTHHSDANLVENKISNSNVGLVLENASSYYDTNNTFLNNVTNVLFRDGSSETTLKSYADQKLFLSTSSKGTTSVGNYLIDNLNILLSKIKGNKKIVIKHEGELSLLEVGTTVSVNISINGTIVSDILVNTITGTYKYFEIEVTVINAVDSIKCISKTIFNSASKSITQTNINTLSQSNLAITFNAAITGVNSKAGYKSYIREINLIG